MYINRSLVARAIIFVLIIPVIVIAQTGGKIRGTVTLNDKDTPLHNVVITIVKLNLSVETNAQGEFELSQVPAGTWSLLVHLEGFPDSVNSVTVSEGETVTLDLILSLGKVRDQITISASGREQSTFDAFQSVTSLDNITLTEKGHTSIGEVLDNQPGVAKRSFGPGSTRPIIRGFDGDRVLVLQDGVQAGSIGSQSGDHGEPIDVLKLERLEVVKGPAALLYGNNALGGIVNAISSHMTEAQPHEGVRGYVSGIGSTNTGQGALSGGVEYGIKNVMLWANGSGQRLGDYTAPKVGKILNSSSRSGSGSAGAGYFGERGFASASYGYDNRRYGIPFAGFFEGDDGTDIDIAMRSHNVRFKGGLNNIGSSISSFQFSLTYNDYRHKEIETADNVDTIGTVFDNDILIFRGLFQQQKKGVWGGSFGFWGMNRRYDATGEEALAPRTTQNAFAGFGLQEFDFKRVSFQLGARVEHNGYTPDGLRDRSFTGFSGAAGVRFDLWEGGVFVVNYTHTNRPPALEELYNNGPHLGNLTFEIGNSNLKLERGDGIEFSLRQTSDRFRAEANFFYYNLSDYVFLAPTGDFEDGLPVADYLQADSRYLGSEVSLGINLHRDLWLNTGLDFVEAQLKSGDQPLPRIPPLRGRIGLDWRWNSLSVRPEVIMARDQDRLFFNETRTPGYTLINLDASYTVATQHVAHILGVSLFNAGDRLYRNHTSFIKDLAPETGRGVRVSYSVRFF